MLAQQRRDVRGRPDRHADRYSRRRVVGGPRRCRIGAFAFSASDGSCGAEVDRRVDQHLRGDRRRAAVAGHQADDGGQVAAGAVAHDGQPVRVHRQLGRVLGDPLGGGVAVLGRDRERVLGRQPVLDRHDVDAGLRCQPGAPPLRLAGVAGHPAAAVEVRDDRRRARGVRADGRCAAAARCRRPVARASVIDIRRSGRPVISQTPGSRIRRLRRLLAARTLSAGCCMTGARSSTL